MFVERTSVGLDVHARSVVAAALDTTTGAVVRRRLSAAFTELDEFLPGLDGPIAVTYEAGRTGFGLVRWLTSPGVRCVVAAPSKLHRPAGTG